MLKKISAISVFALFAANPAFADITCQGPWVISATELTALDSDKRTAEIQKLVDCAKQATTEMQNRLSSISSLHFDQIINDLIEERTALQKLSDNRKQAIGQLENDLIARMKERDKALEHLKSIESQLSDTQDKLSSLSAEREKLNAVLADNSLKIQSFQEEIYKLEKERLDLNDKIKSLTDDNALKAKTIAERKKEIDELSSDLSKAETTGRDQVRQITELKARISELENSLTAIKSLQKGTEDRLSEALGTIGNLNTALNDLKLKYSELQSENSDLSKRLEITSKNLDELQSLKKEIETQVDKLNGALDHAKAERDAALQDNIALNNAKLELERQFAAIKSEKSALETEVDAIKAENDKCKSQVDALYGVRSEFFAKLKEKLKDQKSIRIVGDRFIIQSEVLFNVGSPDLNAHGVSQIKEVAKLLKEVSVSFPTGIHWVLQVNGHTDIQKIIPGGKFSSNWELSTARALTVVKLMQTEGVTPKNLVAAGFGEYQPVDDGKSQESFAKNRRIELKLTDDGPYK